MNNTAEKEIDFPHKKSPFIPEKDDLYVKYGHFDDVLNIIQSRQFMPVWIAGPAGVGKTQMVDRACYETERELFRINFTTETDEADLIGAQRLVEQSGTTVTQFVEGPVVTAIRRGAVLLLDEMDVGHSNRIMCLQSVLEGKGVFLKQTGEWVRPFTKDKNGNDIPNGFQIFATSNTKGRGDETGRFIGTNLLNEAMRDRFVGMLYQDYPEPEMEYGILIRYFVDVVFTKKSKSPTDAGAMEQVERGKKFVKTLTKWAAKTRETYKNGGDIQEVVSPRTLINIIRVFSVFDDRRKSVHLACERYPDDARDSFMQLYDTLLPDDEMDKVIPDNQTGEYDEFKRQTF